MDFMNNNNNSNINYKVQLTLYRPLPVVPFAERKYTTTNTPMKSPHGPTCTSCLPTPLLALARVKHAILSGLFLPSLDLAVVRGARHQVSNTKNLETLISFSQFPLLLALA